MFDEYLREVKDLLLSVVFPFLGWFTPNQITLVAFLLGLGSCVFAYHDLVNYSFYLWLLNRLLDGLDGYVARKTNSSTDFGGYLDIIWYSNIIFIGLVTL